MGSGRSYRVAVIPGDGIGPEVVAEGLKVGSAAAECCGFELRVDLFDLGAERYLRSGEVLPRTVLDEIQSYDAIYLGAVGDPRVPPGILEKGILIALRRGLDLSVNVRPVRTFPGVRSPLADRGADLVVVRENTEGLYAGAGGVLERGGRLEVALEESVNTRKAAERCARYAFALAEKRKKQGKPGKVTLVHKANVLTHAGRLWEEVFAEVGEAFPGVEKEYMHVDAAAMFFVTDPSRFDVVLTDNLFGDILSDLGAGLVGGLGFAPSANLNLEGVYPSLFEPVHGSAPDIAGTGKANPIAAILSFALLLEHMGEEGAAMRIEEACRQALSRMAEGGGAGTWTTAEMGDAVASALRGAEGGGDAHNRG